jgi:hypothetical protein
MKSVKELREGLFAVLRVDSAQRKAATFELTVDPRFIKGGAMQEFEKACGQKLDDITRQNFAALEGVLAELRQHDTPEAVVTIMHLFTSPIIAYRLLAISVLASMSNPEAAKAVALRDRWWSFASKEEKDMVKSLRAGAARAHCACCSKTVRPFAVPPGPWSGTVEEFMNMKIEPDHAFVCDTCRAVVCPVCSGKKATGLGVREFVCTQCGARPLKTIYRAAEGKRAA